MNECLNCGQPVSGRMYCSKRCGDRYTERQRTRTCTEPGCDKPYRAKGYCGSHWNQHFAKPSQAMVACTVCGTMVMKEKRVKRRAVCSDMCKVFLQHGHWPISMVSDGAPYKRRMRAMAKLQAAMTLPSTSQRWYCGQCKRCGSWFIHNMPQTNTCSARCADRLSDKRNRPAAARRRRARKRNALVVENVIPEIVFERDGWRCQIPQCLFRSRAVSRTKKVPHLRAPVRDHIVPLAAGGDESYANSQCAHFLCNSIKSDKAANDQLRLFG